MGRLRQVRGGRFWVRDGSYGTTALRPGRGPARQSHQRQVCAACYIGVVGRTRWIESLSEIWRDERGHDRAPRPPSFWIQWTQASRARRRRPNRRHEEDCRMKIGASFFFQNYFRVAETGLAGLPGRFVTGRHGRTARVRFDLGRRTSFLALHHDPRRAAVHDLHGGPDQEDRFRLDGRGAAVA